MLDFTDDAILVTWCVIGCLHQWFLLVNSYGFYTWEIESILFVPVSRIRDFLAVYVKTCHVKT